MTVKVPSISPPAVIVRIDSGASATAMQGCADANLFPLFFDAQAYNQCEIALAGCVKGVPRALSVRIQQFPLVCAVSSTAYKVQAKTLEGIVVTEWKFKSALANKREQPYLFVSRATSRNAFATLAPLTDVITKWAPSIRSCVERRRSPGTIKL
ncbi:hypothetical protein JG688_00007399 [Phytophthora aleatoria]|uniref:Uncharacterized protein n=1 Tax=Phytophthora aleatoria TaxID=2496075 RepID=A0A8J5MGG8_9STRA|nr:hypothetical protein JG688_00007399 [Phytophthora aleatoria]